MLDLRAAGLLPPIPAALLAGADCDLIAPLRFLLPGESPAHAAPPAGAERAPLAAALAEANSAYGHPRARELAAQFAHPATQLVVAGQQPGLFGGPLYTFTKMVAAALWADLLREAGVPAVAVFWVASEDHDWTEAAQATFPTSDGLRTLDLGPDPAPLMPLGMRTLGPAVENVMADLAEILPRPLHQGWVEKLRHWYRPDSRFGEAFCRLMTHLLGERCPLLLDAMLPALKAAERLPLRRLVERRSEVSAALAGAEDRLRARGLAPQVAPSPGASPLFLFHGGERRRILWQDEGRFSLRGGASEPQPVERLLETIAENPSVVSPGVLARPAVQDAVLGTCLQVLGPGELSYMAQAAAIYPVLNVPPPTVALRPQAIVLDTRARRRLEEMGEEASALLHSQGRDALEKRRDFSAAEKEKIAAALASMRQAAVALDPGLERPWEKTRDQVEKALLAFSAKIDAALSRQNDTRRGRMLRLRETLLPHGKLQERIWSTAYFTARYGDTFGATFHTQIGLDPRVLQVITPPESER